MIRVPLLSFVLLLIAVATARAEPPVWTVRDADSEMTLFGSIHTLSEETDWRSEGLDRTLAEADIVAFEIIPGEDPEADAAQMGRLMVYFVAPPGEPLSSVIPEQTNTRLNTALTELGERPGLFEGLRPWSAGMMLSVIFDESLGRSQEQGVDTVLQAEVPDDTPMIALDDDHMLERSMRVLAAMPLDDQVQLLEEAIEMVERGEGLDMTLEDAWASGDLAALEAEMDAMREEQPIIYQVLLVDRNNAWIERLTQLMQTQGRILVIVGGAHLIGPEGLPTLLSRAGFQVEGPGF